MARTGSSGPGRAGRGPGRPGAPRTGTPRPADRARPATSSSAARAARARTQPETEAVLAAARLPDRRALRRVLVLAGVFVVLAILVVPTLRSYLRQESEINALEQQVQDQREDVARLQGNQARWADPAFVEQQARERLGFVKPGERSYVVISPDAPAQPESGVTTVTPDTRDLSWYSRLAESVEVADRPVDAESPDQ